MTADYEALSSIPRSGQLNLVLGNSIWKFWVQTRSLEIGGGLGEHVKPSVLRQFRAEAVLDNGYFIATNSTKELQRKHPINQEHFLDKISAENFSIC